MVVSKTRCRPPPPHYKLFKSGWLETLNPLSNLSSFHRLRNLLNLVLPSSSTQMEFWGVEVKAGEPLKVKSVDDKLVHLSGACLGELKKGKEDDSVSLFVSVNGQKIVIGSLSSEKSPQISFDLVFETDFELSHNWKNGSIYFTGYKFPDSDSESEDDPIVPKNGKFEVKKEQPSLHALKATAAKPESSSAKPITKSVEPKKEDKPEDDSDSDEEGSAAMLGSFSTKLGTKIVEPKKDDKPLDDGDNDEEDSDSDEEDSDSDEEGSDSDEEGIVAKLGSSSTVPGMKVMEPKKDDKPLDDGDNDEEDSDSDEEDSDSDEEGIVIKLGSSSTVPGMKVMEPKKEDKPLDDSDSDEEDSDSDEEDIEFNGDESSSDFEDDDSDDSDDEPTPKKETSSKKRPAESAPKTLVPEKKAKLITPQKIGSDSKKGGVRVATPYPSKQAVRGTGASNKSKQLKAKQRGGR